MDHYEELGIQRSASPEEIRQAYRKLARLLHPDQCTDAELRALAEIQMKRLNQMLAVLTDPGKRRRYDASLEGVMPVAVPAAARRLDTAVWVWGAAGLIAAVAFGFFLVQSGTEEAPVTRTTVPVAAIPPPAPERKAQGRAAARMPAQAPEKAHNRRREEPQSGEPAQVPEERQPEVEEDGAIPPAPRKDPPAPEAPERAAGFAGNWFYVASVPQPFSREPYRPEYIELRISSRGGTLRGRYRARYKVTDQPISPNVSFEFHGSASAPEASLPWTGPGGAGGAVALKLVSADTLEVRWRARRMGDLGLVSGVATLLRQQER